MSHLDIFGLKFEINLITFEICTLKFIEMQKFKQKNNLKSKK